MAGLFSGYNAETGALRPDQLAARGLATRPRRPGSATTGSPSSASTTRRGPPTPAAAPVEAPRTRRAPRRATRRCSTPAASTRCSSGTTRATPPRRSAQVCGMDAGRSSSRSPAAITENSGRDRTTAWVYSVGWTHHSVGAQYIRGAAILQTLLGNMGRPGGGILALRGHASHPGLDRHPDALRPAAGLHPDAQRAPARRPARRSSTPTRRRPGSGATWTPTW